MRREVDGGGGITEKGQCGRVGSPKHFSYYSMHF